MRNFVNFNHNWIFIKKNISLNEAIVSVGESINIPHTWNGLDGQDGGNDYVRDCFWYKKTFNKSDLPENDLVFIEFKGVNSSCDIYLNNQFIGHHDGGYSTFRFNITDFLESFNTLLVNVDNQKNDTVYPQKADFTFYGGIYRDVNILTVSKNHFDLLYYGSKGVKVKATANQHQGMLDIESYVVGKGTVHARLYDRENHLVFEGNVTEQITVNNVHLWQGIKDPYLYRLDISLMNNEQIEDQVSFNIGFRSFYMDSNEGFYLNGVKYPLRGVCRHQDRPKIGNALQPFHHEEDIALIKSVGANTIRLSHYQQDDYVYELCDKHGFVVWAEIPYISQHMQNANENAKQQMKELIIQQYHHPSIVTWGISNEITISKAGKNCLAFHKEMNDLCHELDDTRKTVIANYMPARIKNKLNRVPDLVSYNLYFGWYLPFTALAGWKLDRYHRLFPNEIIGLAEYGAEGVGHVHNRFPRRGDNTEAYQAIYHEKMIDIINKRDYIWATHLWNMFDFAADARNQGGEPGMNHKGLITFDRQRKKDAFFIYKAHWSKEPFIHLCQKNYQMRTGRKTEVKVYTNLPHVKIYHNDQLVFDEDVDKIAKVKIVMAKDNIIKAVFENHQDESSFTKVKKKPAAYKLKNQKNVSWEK